MVQRGWTTAIPINVAVKGGKYWERHIAGLQSAKEQYENKKTLSKRDPRRIKYLIKEINICKQKSTNQMKEFTN
jgi:hypothetical protein